MKVVGVRFGSSLCYGFSLKRRPLDYGRLVMSAWRDDHLDGSAMESMTITLRTSLNSKDLAKNKGWEKNLGLSRLTPNFFPQSRYFFSL
jgi:hypothetical protein